MKRRPEPFEPPSPSYPHLRGHFAYIIFVCLGFSVLLAGTLLICFRGLGIFSLMLTANPLMFILVLYLVSAGVASILTYFVANRILKPIETLSEATKQVAKGDFSVKIETAPQIEEIDSLYKNFNSMIVELSATETLREDFIANVSHEFKTPLASIEGYATLLSDPDLTEEERAEYAGRIREGARRLSDLTGHILLLSKLENGAYVPENTPFDMTETVRCAILDLEPIWGKKELELLPELAEVTYTGPEGLVRELVQNLISNACKYTPAGGRITVTLEESAAGMVFSVADTGIGMSEEVQKRIFDKFYQADRSHHAQGHGLGLALCRRIAEATGAVITVESEVGVGSRFTVSWPGTSPMQEA